MSALFEHQVAASLSSALGISGKKFGQVFAAEVFRDFFIRLNASKVRTMVVHIVEAEARDVARLIGFLEIGGHASRVHRHEYIGGYTTSTIDHAAVRGEIFLPRCLDAVAIVKFSVLHALQEVHFVGGFIAGSIGLLQAAARGCIVSGLRQSYHTAVAKVDRHLHEALAKTASANNRGAVVVLEGCGKDFTG